MNIVENLLTTAGEECAEVQQTISKSLRFGLYNHNPNTVTKTNVDDIMIEFYQLCAVIEYSQKCGFLPILTQEQITEIKNNKIDNVKRYQELSKALGTLQ